MKKLRKIMDKTFWLYVGLGFLNYGICATIKLIFQRIFLVSEDASYIIAFALQTSISFLLNRYVTFRGIHISRWWPFKFCVSVGISYLVARVLLLDLLKHLMTLPFFISIADWIQSLFYAITKKQIAPADFRDVLVTLACIFVYCVINYIGQRYYVFRPRKEE